MTLLVGFLLLILGFVALVAWAPVLLPFFQGIVVISLLFWGVLCLILGLSQLKAKREFAQGTQDLPSKAENETS